MERRWLLVVLAAVFCLAFAPVLREECRLAGLMHGASPLLPGEAPDFEPVVRSTSLVDAGVQNVEVREGRGATGWATWTIQVKVGARALLNVGALVRTSGDPPQLYRLDSAPPHRLLLYRPRRSKEAPGDGDPPSPGFILYEYDGQEYVERETVVRNPLSLWFRNPDLGQALMDLLDRLP